MVEIRLANEKDFGEIWRIFRAVIAKGDTYVNGANTTGKAAEAKWMSKDAKTFVAEIDEKIVGAYVLKANQVDRGSHVGNASYIVDENARGMGVGKALALHSIASAKEIYQSPLDFGIF